jgi:hypothetical protein
MSAVFHGIELDREGKPAWLRFSMLRLLYRLYATNTNGPRAADWRRRLNSEGFRHQASHFRQCVGKFDRAAGYVARCKDAAGGALGRYSEKINRHQKGEIAQPPDAVSDPDRLTLDEVNADLPVFLDSMLFYLSIQADSFAKLVPYFYEDASAGICTRNFTKQLRWFCDGKLPYDLAYISILKQNRTWRDQLVGWNNGLRGVVAHESGILGVGWAKPKDGLIEPRTSLYRSDGVVEENVFEALKVITAGWFAFLDDAYRHFAPRLTDAGILPIGFIDEFEKTRFFDADELRGLWAYPILKLKA